MNRDEILALSDVTTEDVHVPEWKTPAFPTGITLKVRGLSGTERDAFEESNYKKRGDKYDINIANIRGRLVALSVVNDDGSRMFRDEDATALGKKNAAALDHIFEVARRLSGLTKADVDTLAKNSEAGPNGTSTSS